MRKSLQSLKTDRIYKKLQL